MGGKKVVNNESSGFRDVLGGISKFIKATDAKDQERTASNHGDSPEDKADKEFLFCRPEMLPQRGIMTWSAIPPELAADVLNAFHPSEWPKRTLMRMLGNAPESLLQELFIATEIGPGDKVPLSMKKDPAVMTHFLVSCCIEMYKEKHNLSTPVPPIPIFEALHIIPP